MYQNKVKIPTVKERVDPSVVRIVGDRYFVS